MWLSLSLGETSGTQSWASVMEQVRDSPEGRVGVDAEGRMGEGNCLGFPRKHPLSPRWEPQGEWALGAGGVGREVKCQQAAGATDKNPTPAVTLTQEANVQHSTGHSETLSPH